MIQTSNSLAKFSIGEGSWLRDWDTLFSSPLITNHPPYNILKSDDGSFLIELAVPGWTKDQLTATLEKGVLTVRGEKREETHEEGISYAYKGLSTKAFTKRFAVDEDLVFESAWVEDGLLNLSFCMPEEPESKLKELTIE